MRKIPEEVKQKAVKEILCGNMLLDEVLVKYDIWAKATVKKWLRQYKKDNESTKN